MKLVLPIAYVGAVTNLMLTMGSGDEASQVSAQAVKLEAEVTPDVLTQLREGLPEKFFDIPEKGLPVPSIPELETLGWKTEYEKGKLTLDLSSCGDLDFEDETLEFTGVDVKAIQFEPLGTGMVRFTCNAVIRTDMDGRGKVTALLKHTVGATFSKLTQKPLMEPKKAKDDAANPNQGTLPIEQDSSKLTSDGEPIVPLVH